TLVKLNENLQSQILKLQSLKSKFLINKDLEFDIVALSDSNKDEVRAKYDDLKLRFEKEWQDAIDKISQKNSDEVKANNQTIESMQSSPVYIKGIETFKNNRQYKEIGDKLKIRTDKLAHISRINKQNEELRLQITSFVSLTK